MSEHNLNLITQLEGNLKAFIQLSPQPQNKLWLLDINLFYEGEPAGCTSFNLQGYDQHEAEHIARNIRKNEFMMKEIDEFLWGESD